MDRFNEHRRRDCSTGADGCNGCIDSPPQSARRRKFPLEEVGAIAYQVVDRGHNLMTYQIQSTGRTLVLFPSDLAAVRALLAVLDAEEQAVIDAIKAEIEAREIKAIQEGETS
jgi:hypothetical protein